ncbi:SDHD, membrane anchor subunit of succinate dehydrogenase [Ramaria rubella]|nr:SDHD, membrane anchor subunit of succinate dehydrogenase [Ramaria rubella]
MAAVLARSSVLRRPLPCFVSSLHPRQAATTTYVPGGPILRGSVNDPTTFPPPSKSEGSHHWAFERLLSASLIPLTGAAFATGGSSYPVLDGILGIGLVVHSHLGFDQIVIDYLHTRKFPVLGRIAKWGLRAATAGVLVGVYQFNTNDVGLTELVRRVWHA